MFHRFPLVFEVRERTPCGSAPSDIWMVPHSSKIDPLGFEVLSLSSWLPRPLNLPLWKGLADVWTSLFVKPRHIWSGIDLYEMNKRSGRCCRDRLGAGLPR